MKYVFLSFLVITILLEELMYLSWTWWAIPVIVSTIYMFGWTVCKIIDEMNK